MPELRPGFESNGLVSAVRGRLRPCWSGRAAARAATCTAVAAALFGSLWAEAKGEGGADAPEAPNAPISIHLPELGGRMIRGITVGPIENALHRDQGYGSEACARAMEEARRMGANWVSITPFGRVWDLDPQGISLTFEAPFATNRKNVSRAVQQAHEAGLRVLMVPHLWVESGGWRGEIEPKGDEGWQAWAAEYRRFLLTWAAVAQESGVDMLALGVELRSWVTTARAASFVPLIGEVRRQYSGLLTYAANWDDVEQTVILGELDVIGINAFFPLTQRSGASVDQLLRGGRQVAKQVQAVVSRWNKPVMFTEFGYTTRKDPALRPWEWPEHLGEVAVDEQAQAEAYFALLEPFREESWFAGFFVWRIFSNPEDVSQESEWGFSPRGKRAELVLRDAFASHWAFDGPRPPGFCLSAHRARDVAHY